LTVATALAAGRLRRPAPALAGLFKAREWQLSLPLALFFAAFFVAPLLVMFWLSLFTGPELQAMGLVQYAKFVGDPFNLGILWDTIWLGVQVTVVCLVMGYPLAYAYVRAPKWMQGLLMFAIVMPLLTSVVVRTFAWLVILGRQGIVNTALIELGLTAAPLKLLYTNAAVVVALAQICMPLMALPLITSLMQIDGRLEEASTSLGANAWRTFFRVMLPLTLPGIVAGCLLVFASAVSAFVTQTVIGGGRLIYMPLYIYQQSVSLLNWPFAGAVSIILLISLLSVMFVFNLLGRASRGYAKV
jgi:putative spermidine/putrescine transport system permease protein